MPQTMTKQEREAFLAELHVAVISVADPGRGPLIAPIWYAYEPGGDVCIWTGESSRKVTLMRQAGRFSLCVQQEVEPYKYVSVEGPIVSIEPLQVERDLRPLVYRYLGTEEGARYIEKLGGSAAGAEDVWVRMHPERWQSEDFAKLNWP